MPISHEREDTEHPHFVAEVEFEKYGLVVRAEEGCEPLAIWESSHGDPGEVAIVALR